MVPPVAAGSATSAASGTGSKKAQPPTVPMSTMTTSAVKAQVRDKADWLTAIPAGDKVGHVVRKMSGGMAVPNDGDWLVLVGENQILDVVSPEQLLAKYEIKADGGLSVSGPVRRQIEDLLGMGTGATELTLLAGIQRLARLHLGDIEIPLTPGQWEELQYRADKNQVTVESYLRQIVSRIEDELFHGGIARATGPKV